MKKFYLHFILIILVFAQCNKKDGKIEPGTNINTNTETKVKEIKLDSTVTLIYSNAEKLLMAPGESADINIKSISGNGTIDIIYTNSNPSVAIVSDGKISALANGTCTITTSNIKGPNVSIEVNVQSENLPDINQPYQVSFSKPILIFNLDENILFNPSLLNRLGKPVSGSFKVIFSNQDKDYEWESGTQINLNEGFYRATALSNDQLLFGSSTILFYKNISKLPFSDLSPTQRTSIEEPRVMHISLDWGSYPEYFTLPGAVSKPLTGLKFIGVRTLQSDGKYVVNLLTSFEEAVQVETESGGVISGSSTITAVSPGRGRFRPVDNNYVGAWYGCYVFYNFSGDWKCESNGRGEKINMTIPATPGDVIYSKTHYSDIARNYSSGRSAGYIYQDKLGSANFIDATTKANKYTLKVEIGPSVMSKLSWASTMIHSTTYSHIGLIGYRGMPGYGDLYIEEQNKIRVNDNEGHTYFFTKGKGEDALFGQIDSILYQERYYKTVKIGSDIWFAENLAATKYNNGSPIRSGLAATDWLADKTGAYTYPNKNAANQNTYGMFYNWYAVNNSNGLCPNGWHIPRSDEWHSLRAIVENNLGTAGALKSLLYWTEPNEGATNQSGFSALPAGEVVDANSSELFYRAFGTAAFFWSSSEYDSDAAYYFILWGSNSDLDNGVRRKFDGKSCRCIKD
ncbi:MAG: hypothetical protein NVV82_04090 [Sporocytophaga sp.]|nr:hypothetical protein [Sporocytophaga sp.]